MTANIIIVACLFSSVLNLFQLALPLYSMQIFDRVLPSDSLPTLVSLSLIMFGLTLSSTVIETARAMILSRLAYRADLTLHRPAATKAVEDPTNECSAIKDVDAIRAFILSPLATALLDAPWSLAFIVAIFLLHPLLGWLTVLASAMMLLLGVSGYFLTKRDRAASVKDG